MCHAPGHQQTLLALW